jgi:hypothetical protein
MSDTPSDKPRTTFLYCEIKDPDGIAELIFDLNLPEETIDKYFSYSEYCSLELEIDENLKVVSGRIMPKTLV